MRPFTNEEYRIMIFELTEKEPMSFDMMCQIAQRTMMPLIKKWCKTSEDLRNRQLEDDIMQEIHVRLIKTCVTRFLRRKDKDKINDNPDEFFAWMITVGKNILRDTANEQRRHDFRNTVLRDTIPTKDEFKNIENDSEERFAEAFHIALGAPRRPHIVLTWVMQSALEIYYDVNKITATQIIADSVGDMTLSALWEKAQDLLRDFPLLRITQEELDGFGSKLDAVNNENVKVGDTVYRDYYGNRGGKAAISDWIYRMNQWLSTQIDYYEPFDN